MAVIVLSQRRKSSSTSSTSSASDVTRTPPLFFPNLSVLDLSHNKLATLGADVAFHAHLSELKLQDNIELLEVCGSATNCSCSVAVQLRIKELSQNVNCAIH